MESELGDILLENLKFDLQVMYIIYCGELHKEKKQEKRRSFILYSKSCAPTLWRL